MVQLLYPYLSTGKTVVLTIWTFASEVMSLVFNTLSSFVISFHSKEQTSFNFVASVSIHGNFGAQENSHSFHCFLIYLPRSDGTGCHDLGF